MVLCNNIKAVMFWFIIFTKFGFDAPGEPQMLKQAVVNSQMNQFSLRTSTFQCMGKRSTTTITHNTIDRWIPMKILFHFSFALPLQYFHDPGGSHGNLFLPKWSLVNSQQREKDGGRKGKTRRGEEAKDEEALSLFAFSTCKNVGSCYCAWRTKASVVLNCLTIFRAVLFFFCQVVTWKRLE